MTVTAPSYHPINIEGLSTDTKPSTYATAGALTQAIPPRSSFIETDTGDEFYYTGVLWELFKINGAQIVSPSVVLDNNPVVFIDTSFVKSIYLTPKKGNLIFPYFFTSSKSFLA